MLIIIVVAPEQEVTTIKRFVVPVSGELSSSVAVISKLYPAVVSALSVTPVLTVMTPVVPAIVKWFSVSPPTKW